MSKGTGDNKKPRYAGLDERDVTTAEDNIPVTYFAGVAKLNGMALMSPVVTDIKNTPTSGAKK